MSKYHNKLNIIFKRSNDSYTNWFTDIQHYNLLFAIELFYGIYNYKNVYQVRNSFSPDK